MAIIVRLIDTRIQINFRQRRRLPLLARPSAELRNLPEGLAVTIRRARPDDVPAIAHLAEIDEAPIPSGDLIVAVVGGELWAAASVDCDQGISDPFRPSGELLRALGERAGRRRQSAPERRQRVAVAWVPDRGPRHDRRTHPPLVRVGGVEDPRGASSRRGAGYETQQTGGPAGGRPLGSADPAAERDVRVRREENDAAVVVESPEHEDLGDERTDLSGAEVDDCDDESSLELGRLVVDDLGGRPARAELGPEVDRQLPGGFAGLGEGSDCEHPANAHVDPGEVVELNHGRSNIAGPSAPAGPVWLAWLALITVYVVWGSTYLAIRVMVETVPPLLGAGARFLLAGLALHAWVWLRRGADHGGTGAALQVTRREAAGAACVGILLCFGGNGLVTVAERHIASSLAALVIASEPLVIVLIGAAIGQRVSRRALVGVTVGFVGVTILVLPDATTRGSGLVGVGLVLAASVSWAAGSICSTRLRMPGDLGLSTALQMTAGGAVMLVVGLVSGEAGRLDAGGLSARSMAAFGYLVVFGSIVAYSAYTWLLQHVEISRVSTYAYVNPMIAVLLGWIVLGESISPAILVGASVIIGSVAFIVSSTGRAPGPKGTGRPDRSMVATTRRRV
jgi:drug/metabolite transporter (DMT)-like permease